MESDYKGLNRDCEMRTEKELWEVVLSRPDLFELGLCVWVGICFDKGLISIDEYDFFESQLDLLSTGSHAFWIGPIGELQPRIDWIKKRIETL